ncbi:TetR/AcrR family transcriptional regulator [Streptomyces sp. NPDC006385]|uniref:TetR/AcrR family transcriptional regulator n=1 Tax=Streptomyces sp. NPDC006385 TaxID=3156761 RepID=UPI0033BE327C
MPAHAKRNGTQQEARALTEKPASRPRRGRPPRLSRDQIVATAYEIVRDEGAETLTMRRLAQALGSTAMAVYHHVRDKDELLMLILEHVAKDLPRPPLPEDPRQRLTTVCHLMFDAFGDNPWVVPVLARGNVVGVSALWMTEEILGALVDCGLTHEEAFWAHQTIWYYTAGQVLCMTQEPGGEGTAEDTGRAPAHQVEPHDGKAPHYPEAAVAKAAGADFPHLVRLAADSRDIEARYSYGRGLRHILEGALPSV